MVEFELKVTIVIFITDIIIAPVKIFTEATASVASTVATALSLNMARFNSHNTTYYWSAIVSIVLFCTVFELFGVE